MYPGQPPPAGRQAMMKGTHAARTEPEAGKTYAFLIDVAGQDSVAIGSDWDGMIVPTPALRDASHLPALTEALLEVGLSESQVGKVLRGNVMRVLGADGG